MRSKYGKYDEYHTSADDLSLVTPEGLDATFEFYRKLILSLEANRTYRSQVLGEPQLGRRGLYPTISYVGSADAAVRTMMNFIAYADGNHDMVDISNTVNAPMEELVPIAERLLDAGLLRPVD